MLTIIVKFTQSILSRVDFQYCIEGQCVPYYPDEEEDDDGTVSVDNNIGGDNIGDDDDAVFFPGQITEEDNDVSTNQETSPDDRKNAEGNKRNQIENGVPLWYDPIFTEVFKELRKK